MKSITIYKVCILDMGSKIATWPSLEPNIHPCIPPLAIFNIPYIAASESNFIFFENWLKSNLNRTTWSTHSFKIKVQNALGFFLGKRTAAVEKERCSWSDKVKYNWDKGSKIVPHMQWAISTVAKINTVKGKESQE